VVEVATTSQAVIERNAASVLLHDVPVHLVDLVCEAAEAAGDRVVLHEFERAGRLVDHVVRAQHQTVDVLHWLPTRFLLSKGFAHFEQS